LDRNSRTKKIENNPVNSFKDLEVTKKEVSAQLEKIENIKKDLFEKLNSIKSTIESKRSEAFKDQENKFLLEMKKNKILAEEELLVNRNESFKKRKIDFDESMKEAVVLVGREILAYKSHDSVMEANDEIRKNIETHQNQIGRRRYWWGRRSLG
jgi:hypothetical protein